MRTSQPGRARLLLALVAVSLVGGGRLEAQSSRREVPRALRGALIGCWDLGAGEHFVIEPRGAAGLRARWEAPSRHEAIDRFEATMAYDPERRVVASPCGPRSQHGQTCSFSIGDDGRVAVVRTSGFTHHRTTATVARCAPGARVAEAAPPAAHPIPADAPLARLLGARRRDVDAGRASTGEEGGWTRYGDALALSFEAGIVMRARLRVGVASCEDAAIAAGLAPRAGVTPLRRANGCEWPGISPRHRLGPHLAARYADGVMEIWRVP